MSQSLLEQAFQFLPTALKKFKCPLDLSDDPRDLDLTSFDLDDLQAWLTWSMAVEVERLRKS